MALPKRIVVNSETYELQGCGMDKGYYHKADDVFGYIFTSDSIAKEEFDRTGQLTSLNLGDGIKIPGKELINLESVETIIEKGYCIYQIDHVHFIKNTFKPKMMNFEVSSKWKSAIAGITPSSKGKLISNLKTLHSKLEDVCKYVSELTIAFDATGIVYIIDLAGSGSAGSDIEPIKKGLNNMISSLSSQE